MKQRLDQQLVRLGVVLSRSQAESYIKLGQVTVNGRQVNKPGFMVDETDEVKLQAEEQYVSRAALKLASVTEALKLNFTDKVMLDVGSSTGGFTDYALQHGVRRVVAVDVGSEQLHPRLRDDQRVELHEKTDIRSFTLPEPMDIVLIDVSFISLREILPTIARLSSPQTQIVAMVKPQFEAGQSSHKHKGVIKNEKMRRDIMKDFEQWVQQYFVLEHKADSQITGAKGNQERFYLLRKAS